MENGKDERLGLCLSWITLSSIAVLSFCAGLYQRWSRLRHVPGPFVSALTDIWITYKLWRGQQYQYIVNDLHKRYGPVVRWGPNRVSFEQPEAIQSIFGITNVLSKSDSYGPLIMFAQKEEIPTLITLRDEKHVSSIKRLISSGFTQSAWLKQENQVDEILTDFIDHLQQRQGQLVVLDDWFRFWVFDTLSKLAFSEDRGMMRSETDVDGIFAGGRARFAHWREWMLLPALERFVFKNTWAQRLQPVAGGLTKFAMSKVQERRNADATTLDHDLLGRYIAASRQAPDVIPSKYVLALTISTIHAGSETTATTMNGIFQKLMKHPRVLSKLQDEIWRAKLPQIPAFSDVAKLPYLDAVIRESMRISAISPFLNERQVGAGGITICGIWLPAGTNVSLSHLSISRNKAIYGADPEEFRPERWSDADEATWHGMERASLGFSAGRRVCLGQHLAQIEMKKAIAALITAFEIRQAGSETSKPASELRVLLSSRR